MSEKLARHLNRHNLAIAAICTEEVSRYCLSAVQVTAERTEATDGHRLICVTTAPGGTAKGSLSDLVPFQIPASVASLISGRMKEREGEARDYDADESIQVRQDDTGISLSFSDDDIKSVSVGSERGKFPDIQKTIDGTAHAPHAIAVNPRLFAGVLLLFAEFLESRDDSAAHIYLSDPESPMRIEAENISTGQKMTALIMSMRISPPEQGNK